MRSRFLFAAVLLGIAFSTCNRNTCKLIFCQNGECVDGTCVCEEGWKGEYCDIVDDPCFNVICFNGNCDNGICDCDPGFEGSDCGTSINTKFNGIYSLDEDCIPGGSPAPYTVSIIGTSINPTSLTISRLWDQPTASAYADVGLDGTTFVIPRQHYDGTFEIEGSGSLDSGGHTIQISYTVYDDSSNVLDNCSGTMRD